MVYSLAENGFAHRIGFTGLANGVQRYGNGNGKDTIIFCK